MPAIILELIEMITAAKESETIMEGFEAITRTFMGSKAKLLKKAMDSLTGAQEVRMSKAIGEEFTQRIKVHFKQDPNKHKPIKKFDVSGHSSWVKSLAWNPVLSTLSLTVKSGKRENNAYKLPFFPRSAVKAIEDGASPGKTIWRKYWRIVGKGKFNNKAKNLFKVRVTQKTTKIASVAVPSLKLPKKTPKKLQMKNILKQPAVKTANIPKTGAKGVKVKIKMPKIRKY